MNKGGVSFRKLPSTTLHPVPLGNSGENNEEVPRDITCEAVNDLRIVFVTYQIAGNSFMLLRHLLEITQMMGVKTEKIPTPAKLASMAGIEIPNSIEDAWAAQVEFKDFVRFFIILNMDNKKVEVRTKDIFRALDCDDSGEITAEELGKLLTSIFKCMKFILTHVHVEESLNSMGMGEKILAIFLLRISFF